ncbi:MAG: hypothetical protein AAGG38_08725 [Planctomycetota bacterium]
MFKTSLRFSSLLLCLAVAPVGLAEHDGHDGHDHHQAHHDPDAKAILKQVKETVGSYADLKDKVDVEYTYTYRDNASGKSDVSTERYLFEGELSWAKYTTSDKFVFPDRDGIAVQGWNGREAWVTLDGQRVTDEDAVGLAKFLRPTNFYWFAMMQKLQDPGTLHEHLGTREHEGVEYDEIKLTFDVPEGTAADTYVLYVNPETHLVDRFLFTVVDFGVVDTPFLMEVEHEAFGNIMLPVTRRYTPSDWEGNVPDDAVWVDEIMEDITFGKGFTAADFDPPSTD